jgi:outer membrane protein OmpA-like peptidoglycan-associated protein
MGAVVVVVLLLVTMVSGCASTKGAAYGTGVDAAAGGATGGDYMDPPKREMEKVLANQDRIAREGNTLRASLSSDVLFESGSARLQPGADTKLLQIAEILQRYPRTYVEVTGHTDNRGTETSNQYLSERRAESVRDTLAKAGVDSARITTRGEGERRPVAGNDTAIGRATNRRVDITIRPDEGLAQEQRGGTEGAPPAPAEEPH